MESPSEGKVLLVDDNDPLLRATARHLTKAGYQVVACSSGTEAVTELTKHSFDVIVSDISMQMMDGIELLRTVREHDRDLPVLLMTGAPTVTTAAQAVEYGAFKYLVKPVAIDELLAAIHRAVQLYRLAGTKREALRLLGTTAGEDSGRLGLEASFQRALGSLWMAFQPIVLAPEGKLFGYEALMRSGEPSLPHPGAVLDAAERLDELHRLGRTIRDSAAAPCDRDGEWLLFVNLHPRDILDASLLDPKTPLASMAPRVVLEITERASLDRISDLQRRVKDLRTMGYRIAIDDLGAGYSGLASFVQLEPEYVKFDMSIVREVHLSSVKQKLIRSMTTMCHDMGLRVIAEGVECAEERDTLISLGCNLLQGYHFGKPGKGFTPPRW
ncbi:MAG: EAL domain-containing protein [Polyangiaceae bacterium]